MKTIYNLNQVFYTFFYSLIFSNNNSAISELVAFINWK